MSDEQREFEFIMEGITTRMQIAMEKLSDSNKALRNIVKYVCIVMLLAILIMAGGFLMLNKQWINHINDVRASGVVSAGASAEISQHGQGADDR